MIRFFVSNILCSLLSRFVTGYIASSLFIIPLLFLSRYFCFVCPMLAVSVIFQSISSPTRMTFLLLFFPPFSPAKFNPSLPLFLPLFLALPHSLYLLIYPSNTCTFPPPRVILFYVTLQFLYCPTHSLSCTYSFYTYFLFPSLY